MSFLNSSKYPGKYSLWRSLPLFLCALLLLDEIGTMMPGGGHRGLFQQMAIATLYYVDYSLGVDANNALGWATAMKTITQVTKNMADGDSVFCAKSTDPTSVGTATWTAGDRTVTLNAACTLMIYACEDSSGEARWWGATTNCSSSTTSTAKEGASAAQLDMATAFTTGLAFSANLGADLNCSNYQQVSMWVRSVTAALIANRMAFVMYSDTAYPPTTAVFKGYIPAIPTTGLWMPVTWNTGGSLGTVRQIALVVEIDGAAARLIVDDIIACKASSSADSLSLTSLISKNTTNEPWFAIGSINGTDVELESIGRLPTSTIGSYGGTTEPVTTYKRETIKTTPVATSTTAVQTINDSGAAGLPITIEGGYNTTSGARDGVTWYDGGNGYGYGVYATGKSYMILKYFGEARYQDGYRFAGTLSSLVCSNLDAAGSTGDSFTLAATATGVTLSNFLFSGGATYGVYLSNGGGLTGTSLTTATLHGCYCGVYVTTSLDVLLSGVTANASVAAYPAFDIESIYSRCRLVNCTADGKGLQLRGLYVNTSGTSVKPVELVNFTTLGSTTDGIALGQSSSVTMKDSSIAENLEVVFVTTTRDDFVTSTNHDDAEGSHFRWEYGATYNTTQAADCRHTTGTNKWAWQLSPTDAARSSTWPLRLPIGQVKLTSGVSTVVTVYLKRNTNLINAGLVCPGGQITGIATDIADWTDASGSGTWELQSITLQSTENGVVTVEAQAYTLSSTTGTVYIDDISCTRSEQFKGLDWGTGSGPVYTNQKGGGAW